MLNVTLSNRFEVLLDTLLERLSEAPDSPFRSEQIIVPSAAIRRKVTLAAADRFGICANAEFSYLAQWLWRQIGRIVPVSKESPFAPPVLSWRVHRILEDGAFVREHPRLASYLEQADDVMRYDLSRRIAALLDEYVAYRPDWLEAWSAGVEGIPGESEKLSATPAARFDCKWQAALWRRIVHEVGLTGRHPSMQFFEKLTELGPQAAGLDWPGRVHLFCLPTMPPQYIHTLNQLSNWVDLQLYVLNPCRDYWYEIIDPRRLSILAASGKADYHESGNRLLASWGKQTQAQLALLHAETPLADTGDRFVANITNAANHPSLLARVQDAILDLSELAPEDVVLEDGDRSIEVHVCHSPTRELEVLHDQLLALLASPNPPQPHDILVVMPDLEQAAPLIDAVFGRHGNYGEHGDHSPATPRIPYVVTGRGSSKVNPAARVLLDLLGLLTSRFEAMSVFNLLRQPLVARRFSVEDELDTVHDWLAQSGIRWGLDGSHRKQFGLPCGSGHSFEDGLHRLFMGFALPASASEPFNGRLPAGNPEGKGALALGCLWHFVYQLNALRGRLSSPLAADQWMQALFEAIDSFMLAIGDEIDELEEVRGRIRELHAGMASGCGSHPISLETVRAALTGALDDPAHGGVPSGSVTFTSMSSLRNLPYRIVCVIGLNEGSFPSDSKPAEFDLMQFAPRLGDRQRRLDDRNLFLDLLLAARERLYLSYVGRSVRDDSPLPPSVLVAELLDCLAPVRDRLVVRHSLQAFSVDYFSAGGDARLVSYNLEYREALRQKLEARTSPALPPDETPAYEGDDEREYTSEAAQPFFMQPLPGPGVEFRSVSLAQLISFFRNPCRYLLRQRLGIAFADEQEELSQHEPFVAGREERSQLSNRILPLFLEGRDMDDILACARAGVEFPAGRLGEVLLEQELGAIKVYAQNLVNELSGEILPPHGDVLEFDLDGESWQLHGAFGDLRASGLVRHRYDAVRPGDYLAGWIEHLFLNAAAPSGAERQTVWHSRDGLYRLRSCEQPREHLLDLLRLYREGLSRPLRFFPRSAWQYATGNINAAAKTWEISEFTGWGESADPSYKLALRGVPDPLDAEFARTAEAVLHPLLQHIEDPRLA